MNDVSLNFCIPTYYVLREAFIKKSTKKLTFVNLEHFWEKKLFLPPWRLKTLGVWGTPPLKVTKKSVSKMTPNGLKWILNRSLKS